VNEVKIVNIIGATVKVMNRRNMNQIEVSELKPELYFIVIDNAATEHFIKN
jgi:hypothetical protein